MKRLIYCLDGTSNKYDSAYPTNVVMMHKSIAPTDDDGVRQIPYYDTGVGTKFGELILGMAVGLGLMKNVLQAYQHLCENYEVGDEIFIFGFSRGAYTARSLGGLIRLCGIIDADKIHEINTAKEIYENRLLLQKVEHSFVNKWLMQCSSNVCANEVDFKNRLSLSNDPNQVPPIVKIKYIGVWDTVKTLGINEKKYDWHDDSLSEFVEYARHAIALDERRKKFNVTEWDNIEDLNKIANEEGREGRPYEQMWFPGGHGSIGGGGPVKGLSDEAFIWVLQGAKEAGLKVYTNTDSEIFMLRPNALSPLDNTKGKKPSFFGKVGSFAIRIFGNADRKGPKTINQISSTTVVRYFCPSKYLPNNKKYNPGSLKKILPKLKTMQSPYDQISYRALFEGTKQDRLGEDEQKMITINSDKYVVYSVRKGDSLSSISKNFTGSFDNWKKIHNANSASISNPDLIYVGERILIPLNLLDGMNQ